MKRSLQSFRSFVTRSVRINAPIHDSNEAMITQQLLSRMLPATDRPNVSKDTGTILERHRDMVKVSGLMKASIGSMIRIEFSSKTVICHGIVLYLEQYVAHVALLLNKDQSYIKKGMNARLVAKQVTINIPTLNDCIINPLDAISGSNGKMPSLALNVYARPSYTSERTICDRFHTKLLAIDLFKPLVYGYRFMIAGRRNFGKTRLVLDILKGNRQHCLDLGKPTPHIVYVSIGKSAMRVQQLKEAFGDMKDHMTIIAATDQDPPISQYLAPYVGYTITEHLSQSTNCVLVYDDLVTHSSIISDLLLQTKLSYTLKSVLNHHAMLLEPVTRDRVLTIAVATADAVPEEMQPLVDENVVLQTPYPSLDITVPGSSVRGPPYQGRAMWKWGSRLRSRMNECFQLASDAQRAKELGFGEETNDFSVYQEMTRRLFTQSQSKIQAYLGVVLLATVELESIPLKFDITLFLNSVERAWKTERIELHDTLEKALSNDSLYTPSLERIVMKDLYERLDLERQAPHHLR